MLVGSRNETIELKLDSKFQPVLVVLGSEVARPEEKGELEPRAFTLEGTAEPDSIVLVIVTNPLLPALELNSVNCTLESALGVDRGSTEAVADVDRASSEDSLVLAVRVSGMLELAVFVLELNKGLMLEELVSKDWIELKRLELGTRLEGCRGLGLAVLELNSEVRLDELALCKALELAVLELVTEMVLDKLVLEG